MAMGWQVDPGPPRIIWKDGLTHWAAARLGSASLPPDPPRALGIAILVNGYWTKEKPAILADGPGHKMLKEIAAAI
jgi:hypothetical protein